LVEGKAFARVANIIQGGALGSNVGDGDFLVGIASAAVLDRIQ